MNILHKAKILLIDSGKMMPFVLCFVAFVSYSEDAFALFTSNIVNCGGYCVLYKPISWFLGNYFEYNIPFLVILTIISYALNTCYWNKIAIVYLFLQLFEKNYFLTIELNEQTLYAIIITNIAVSALLTTKGMIILWKK